MLTFIQIMLGLAAGGVLLVLTSETFADSVSRLFEAALERVEYRLAVRAERRAEFEPRAEPIYARALVQGEY